MPIRIDQGLTQEELQRNITEYQRPVDTSFHIDTTIEELLSSLHQEPILHDVFYFYAVDDENRLYGVIPTRDILFTDPKKRLIDIVDEDIVTLYEGVTVGHALKILNEHQFLSVPIVDDEYRLVGIFEITIEDINFSRRIRKSPVKETQDIFQVIGFTIEKSKLDSKWSEYRYRMPWLLSNIFAGFMCAAIAYYYEATLAKVVTLSMFIPLVLTLSESISMQSMAISLQFIHYGQVSFLKTLKRLKHEFIVAFFLGLTSAMLLAFYYMFGYDADWIPDQAMFAIAISIFMSMTIAASFGTLFPFVLHGLSLDPKIAAGPVVLMLTDIVTTAIYLSFATWLLL